MTGCNRRRFLLGCAVLALASFLVSSPSSHVMAEVADDHINLDGDFDEDMDMGGFEMPDEFMDDDDHPFGEDDEGEGLPGIFPPGSGGDAAPTAAPTNVKTLPPKPYVKPDTSGLHFVETFETDWMTRWTKSAKERFSGTWERALRQVETLVGDYGVKVMDKAKHHALAARFPKISAKDNGLVVSYEAKFEEGLTCGGAYLKVFDSHGMDLKEFDNETPYVIMFGPDKCGGTNKIHLIIKSKNPVDGEWSEHHLNAAANVPAGTGTHLYTLRINTDDTYEVLVDGESKRKGSMHEDFTPAFTPEKEIDDPEDKKPEDWIDEPKMDDPEATKPGDWDEDAPRMVPDPDATMPDGWEEDAPSEIPDPEAMQPEHWDVEEDGEWSPPMIPNAACSVGCGPWKAPEMKNPDFKGKWVAPKIDNPEYKGVWAPRKINNPKYYENKHPHELSGVAVDAVGFELWTMDSGLLFDNIIVSHDWDATSRFIDSTFNVRREIESSSAQAAAKAAAATATGADGYLGGLHQFAIQKPFLFAGMSLLSVITSLWLIFRVISLFKVGSTKTVAPEKKEKAEEPTAPKKEKSEKENKSKLKPASSSGEDEEEEEEEEEIKATKTKAKASEETPSAGKARRRGGRPAPAD